MRKVNKISKIAVKSELRKVYRAADNSFKQYDYETKVIKHDYRSVSQASASDLIITDLLKTKANINNIYKACIDFVSVNDVYFKNYENDKSLILLRLKRHLTSDNLQRLSKRAISLT
jgi:hypothetical protein